MGTWGIKTFENDGASDWVWELEESEDLSVLEAALVIPDGDFLEAPVAENMLAAAEVVLALLKKPRPGLPEEVATWVAGHPKLDAGRLVPRAIKAIDAVLGETSELKELWAETDDFAAWSADVQAIRAALLSF